MMGETEAGEPHRAEVDVFSAEPLGLPHSILVGVPAGALRIVRPADNAAQLTGGAAVAVFVQHLPFQVGYRAGQAGGAGKGVGAFDRQLQVDRAIASLNSDIKSLLPAVIRKGGGRTETAAERQSGLFLRPGNRRRAGTAGAGRMAKRTNEKARLSRRFLCIIASAGRDSL